MSYRELLIGCGAKRVKDLSLPTAEELRDAFEPGGIRHQALHDAAAGGLPPPRMDTFPRMGTEFRDLVTLDINRDHEPDLYCDLSNVPFECYHTHNVTDDDMTDNGVLLPDIFTEIHAYEVLEHIGAQGDYRKLFGQFSEFWRVLKPGGFFFATCPSVTSRWCWGDPSHARVIQPETLTFLSQKEYARQVGVTAMSDFRSIYKADFDIIMSQDDGETHRFVLRAVK